jgi:agmatinase
VNWKKTLLTSPPSPFSGLSLPFSEADYVVVGFPFDLTSTYRFGAREGPNALREASLNIETYSLRTRVFLEDLKIHDAGDVAVSEDVAESFSNLKEVVSRIFQAGKKPVVLGGEHTLTFSAVESLPKDTGIVSFDAHFDLRDEYEGKKFSHTTFMRRLAEKIGPDRIIFAGVRAVCKEDLAYVESRKIRYLTSDQILSQGSAWAAGNIRDFLRSFKSSYFTVDMDVLDPAFAPAVGNPEPEGLNSHLLLEILRGVVNGKAKGFDLVEIAPRYDSGITAVLGAKIIFEALCLLEAKKFD